MLSEFNKLQLFAQLLIRINYFKLDFHPNSIALLQDIIALEQLKITTQWQLEPKFLEMIIKFAVSNYILSIYNHYKNV